MTDSCEKEHAVDILISGVVPPETAKKSGVCILFTSTNQSSVFYTKYRVFCGFSGINLFIEEYVKKLIVILYV